MIATLDQVHIDNFNPAPLPQAPLPESVVYFPKVGKL
jgi:hypothetical protein